MVTVRSLADEFSKGTPTTVLSPTCRASSIASRSRGEEETGSAVPDSAEHGCKPVLWQPRNKISFALDSAGSYRNPRQVKETQTATG